MPTRPSASVPPSALADRLGSPPQLVVHDEAFATSTRRHWSDIVGCVAFFAVAVWDVRIAPAVSLALVPVFGYEIAAGLAFLTRRRPRASLRGWGPRVAAYGATFIVPVFLAVAASRAPHWLTPVARLSHTAAVWAIPTGNILIFAGAALSAWGLWHLRASISLEPAARGLVTRGPYSVARHPLYLAYLLSYTGVVLQHPTPQVAIMFIAWFIMTWARINYEERVLVAVYPEYVDYRRRVGAFGPKPVRAMPSVPPG